MTDDIKRGRVARLRERQAAFTERCTRHFAQPTATEDLYCDAAFMDHSPERDAQAWCKRVIPLFERHGVPFGILAHRLQAFHDNPSAPQARDAAREAEHIVTSNFSEWPAAAVDLAREAYQRCMFFAWCDGDELAAWHVARIAYAISKTATDELTRALCRATMLDAIRNPTPYYLEGGGVRERAHAAALLDDAESGLLAHDLLSARARNEGEEARRRKEAQAQVLKDLLDNPRGGVQCDVYQIVPDDIENEGPPVRGRVVFPAFEAASSTTEGRRTGPSTLVRVRVGDVAGKLLPYDQPNDPKAFRGGMLAEFPYAVEAVDAMAQDLVVAQQLGYAWLRNSLVSGAPGLGKTRFARRAAELAGLRCRVHSASGSSDGSFAGTSAQWASARMSASAQALLAFERANGCLIIDEVDKAGTSSHNGRLDEALLPFLERETSRRIVDPMLELPLDLSCMSYVLTANDLHKVSGPLRDRLRVLHIPKPRPEHLPIIARTMVTDLREENGADARWMPDLDGDELDLLAHQWKGGSMRRLRRLVEVLVAGRAAFAPRH